MLARGVGFLQNDYHGNAKKIVGVQAIEYGGLYPDAYDLSLCQDVGSSSDE